MTHVRLVPFVGLAFVVLGSVAARPNRSATPEVLRIQSHFDSVLAELSTPPVASGLSRDQTARRASLVQELRAYRDRGVFPRNYDFPDRATPYFVDRKTGTLCAVANLLAFTRRRDMVDRVAAADNNIWVPSLAGDTAFTAWLDRNGLTLAEAARIQVPYMGEIVPVEEPAASISSAAIAAMVGAVGSGVWNVWGNSDGHRRAGTVLGLTTGLVSTAVGVSTLAGDGSPNVRKVGGGAAAVGVISTALAVRAMLHRRNSDLAAREVKTVPASDHTITPGLSVGRDGRTTMSLAVRF